MQMITCRVTGTTHHTNGITGFDGGTYLKKTRRHHMSIISANTVILLDDYIVAEPARFIRLARHTSRRYCYDL